MIVCIWNIDRGMIGLMVWFFCYINVFSSSMVFVSRLRFLGCVSGVFCFIWVIINNSVVSLLVNSIMFGMLMG